MNEEQRNRIQFLLSLMVQIDAQKIIDGYYQQRGNPAPGMLLRDALKDAQAALHEATE